jgi:MerR family redox-sensitive transcriptional activator SoxR
MTIGEVAERAGVKPSAIRYYEKAGLLTPPARINGRRIYAPQAMHQLVIILFAKNTGFTLKEIRCCSAASRTPRPRPRAGRNSRAQRSSRSKAPSPKPAP